MSDESGRLPRLLRRPREAHKGEFGHILIAACSPGMTGAGCLAAAAAQRAGAGLVTLALPRSLAAAAGAALGSAMYWPLPETPEGALGLEAGERILNAADRFDVFAIGPGLRTAEQTRQMVQSLVAALRRPVVVDADGLNGLVGHLAVLAARSAPTILTPHPGEMSRLIGSGSPAEVQADRLGTAQRFAQAHRALVVLKGQGTVVADGERFFINDTGNPGMAKGGMGDVLTGLLAGLLGQGLAPFEAARLAVFVHGLAGDLAAQEKGELSLIAEDVLQWVPRVFRAVQVVSQQAAGATIPSEQVRSLPRE